MKKRVEHDFSTAAQHLTKMAMPIAQLMHTTLQTYQADSSFTPPQTMLCVIMAHGSPTCLQNSKLQETKIQHDATQQSLLSVFLSICTHIWHNFSPRLAFLCQSVITYLILSPSCSFGLFKSRFQISRSLSFARRVQVLRCCCALISASAGLTSFCLTTALLVNSLKKSDVNVPSVSARMSAFKN